MTNTFWKKKEGGHGDHYQTHIDYLKIIDKFIPKDIQVNDPFYGSGLVKTYWKELGRNIIHEDSDFFTEDFSTTDYIISNPPFSKIADILTHLFIINKPFSLLIPLQKIAQVKIQRILKEKNIQVIISDCYKGFLTPEGEPTRCSSMYTCWLCYKMDLDKDLIFL